MAGKSGSYRSRDKRIFGKPGKKCAGSMVSPEAKSLRSGREVVVVLCAGGITTVTRATRPNRVSDSAETPACTFWRAEMKVFPNLAEVVVLENSSGAVATAGSLCCGCNLRGI